MVLGLRDVEPDHRPCDPCGMPLRDQWTFERTCPKCGKVAKIGFVEDDHPYHPAIDKVVVNSLTDGFRFRGWGKSKSLDEMDIMDATEIECVACGEIVR